MIFQGCRGKWIILSKDLRKPEINDGNDQYLLIRDCNTVVFKDDKGKVEVENVYVMNSKDVILNGIIAENVFVKGSEKISLKGVYTNFLSIYESNLCNISLCSIYGDLILKNSNSNIFLSNEQESGEINLVNSNNNKFFNNIIISPKGIVLNNSHNNTFLGNLFEEIVPAIEFNSNGNSFNDPFIDQSLGEPKQKKIIDVPNILKI